MSSHFLKDNIKFLLSLNNINQKELTDNKIISAGYLSDILKGKNINVSYKKISDLSKFFKVSVDSLTNISITNNNINEILNEYEKVNGDNSNIGISSKTNDYQIGLKPLIEMNIIEMKQYYKRINEDYEKLKNILYQFDTKDLEPIKEIKQKDTVDVPVISNKYIEESNKHIEKIKKDSIVDKEKV